MGLVASIAQSFTTALQMSPPPLDSNIFISFPRRNIFEHMPDTVTQNILCKDDLFRLGLEPEIQTLLEQHYDARFHKIVLHDTDCHVLFELLNPTATATPFTMAINVSGLKKMRCVTVADIQQQ